MADFQFRYESVLEQRRQAERQRQRELAELEGRRQSMHAQLRQMQQTIDQSRQQISEQLIGRVDLTAIGSVSQYSAQVTLRGQQIVQQLAEVERQVEGARQHLQQATRQRKIMEQLKDREHERWRWQQQRAERRQQDELANQQYVRLQREPKEAGP